MNLSSKQRKILKVVGFVVLALVVFVFALARTFPYDRVKDRMIEQLSAKYDVEIGEVKPGILPGKMIIESMKLQTRPTKPGEKPALIYLETVEVDIGLLALLGGKVVVDIEASVPGGTVEVTFEESKAGQRIKIQTDGLALGTLPWVKEAVGLPMAGPLHVEANIWLPKKKWKDADGSISFSCAGCTVGDGKTKLALTPTTKSRRRRNKNAAIFASAGITVPKLKLGVAEGEISIKKGTAKVEKKLGAKSKDGWVELDLEEFKFSDPVSRTKLPGCLRFQLSESLKDREKEFGNIEFMLSERSRQDDGSYAIPLKGSLKALRPNHRKRCKGAKGDRSGSSKKKVSRPTINVPKETEKTDKVDKTDKPEEGEPAIMPAPGRSGPALSTDMLKNGATKADKLKAIKEASGKDEDAKDEDAKDDDAKDDDAKDDATEEEEGEDVEEGGEGGEEGGNVEEGGNLEEGEERVQ